jgi:hypothetical protein
MASKSNYNDNNNGNDINKSKIKNTNDNSDITAEWTVHAQLTISHPGNKNHKKPNDDNKNQLNKQQQPVKVVYNWCSDDAKQQKFNNSNDKTSELNKSSFKANAVFSSESPKVIGSIIYTVGCKFYWTNGANRKQCFASEFLVLFLEIH